jgi:hypothetical protein
MEVNMDRISAKRVLVHRLLYKIGAMECKADILAGYGVKSTTELTERQLDELIGNLNNGLRQEDHSAAIRRWRSNALTLMNKCGVYVTNDDWSNVNHFMKDPRICGKMLNECSIYELQELCKKLRVMAEKKRHNDAKAFVKNLILN